MDECSGRAFFKGLRPPDFHQPPFTPTPFLVAGQGLLLRAGSFFHVRAHLDSESNRYYDNKGNPWKDLKSCFIGRGVIKEKE
jgi:hypothetical protein